MSATKKITSTTQSRMEKLKAMRKARKKPIPPSRNLASKNAIQNKSSSSRGSLSARMKKLRLGKDEKPKSTVVSEKPRNPRGSLSARMKRIEGLSNKTNYEGTKEQNKVSKEQKKANRGSLLARMKGLERVKKEGTPETKSSSRELSSKMKERVGNLQNLANPRASLKERMKFLGANPFTQKRQEEESKRKKEEKFEKIKEEKQKENKNIANVEYEKKITDPEELQAHVLKNMQSFEQIVGLNTLISKTENTWLSIQKRSPMTGEQYKMMLNKSTA